MSLSLAATARTEFGKGAARRIRRADQVPAVLYGHGAAPIHVTLPGHATMLALKHANALLTITLDGEDHLAIAKDVQRHATRDTIEHVDLLTVVKGEKITVVVPIRVVGESAPGTIHVLETQNVQIQAEATNLPEVIEAPIDGLGAGDGVRGADLVMPADAVFLGDPNETIVAISIPQMEEEPTAAEALEGEAAAEGEAAVEGEAPAAEADEEA